MGNWYTNVALKDVKADDVISYLNQLGRRAIVDQSAAGWVVVYDAECEKFDLDTLESLALTLSAHLQCATLASFNADDDILWLGIFEKGTRSSRYTSDPTQFEDGDEFPAAKEFSLQLCRVFEKPNASFRVYSILRRAHGVWGFLRLLNIRLAYLFEIQRHMDLAEALVMPAAFVGLGYKYVERGELAEGMSAENLVRTHGVGGI